METSPITGHCKRLVHFVDDDEAVRKAVAELLCSAGYTVNTYCSGPELLKLVRDLEPGCLLIDIRMPEMNGLQLQAALKEAGIMWPVVIITGHGDVGLAVRAMRAGAIQFIEKPFSASKLLGAIKEAHVDLSLTLHKAAALQTFESLLKSLTARENQVLGGMVNGWTNKDIAQRLQISSRTVEVHRANILAKLNVKRTAEALHIAFGGGMSGYESAPH